MKKGSILLVFFFLMLMQSEAQMFSKVFYDSAGAGLQGCFIDESGGYVFTGTTSSYDYFIMKTTTAGHPVWIKQFLSSYGSLKTGIKTNDGGYAFTGESTIEPYFVHALSFVKTDSLGMLQSVHLYWIDGQYYTGGKQILQDASGNFYLLDTEGYNGDPYSQCFSIIKLDSQGSFLNQKNYCSYLINSFEPMPESFSRTADGGFIIVGTCGAPSSSKFFLMKTDSLLSMQWYKLFGDQTNLGSPYFIQQKTNGDYLVTGTFYFSFSATLKAIVAEFTESGSLIWSKTYEAIGRKFYPSGFASNADGTITVGGSLDYPDARFIIMNTDSIGNLNWSKLLLSSANNEHAHDFKATPDGGFIFCGNRIENGNGHPLIIKTDFDGNTPCGDSAFSLIVSDIVLTEQSDSINEVNTGFNSGDSWSFSQMNFDSLSDLCLSTGIHEVKNTESVTLFPDPASDMITIIFPDQPNFRSDVSIFDATGKLVRRFSNVHSARLEIPVAEIGSDGLYFNRVMANDGQIFSGKFLIQR